MHTLAIWISIMGLALFSNTSQAFQSQTDELPVKLYSDNDTGFVVIAHRGASAYHPENTMSAIRAAVEMEADMIEIDVLLSKDGVPVVIHDEDLSRTTNGKGLVSQTTLEDLRKLDAGSWFSEDHVGEPIPTLEEVIEYTSGKIALNIEIKSDAVTEQAYGGIEEKALELVKKYGMEEYVLFSSFDYRSIKHLKELNVDISVALLYESKQSGKRGPSQLVSDLNADAFNCSYKQYSKRWAKETMEHKIPVFIYTVNSERLMRKMINRGAAGIFSDKPDVLKTIVDNMWKSKER